MTTIRAVVFDVGETLVDETAAWDDWADWLGVPRFTFQAVLGGVIARGLDHRVAFELIRRGSISMPSIVRAMLLGVDRP